MWLQLLAKGTWMKSVNTKTPRPVTILKRNFNDKNWDEDPKAAEKRKQLRQMYGSDLARFVKRRNAYQRATDRVLKLLKEKYFYIAVVIFGIAWYIYADRERRRHTESLHTRRSVLYNPNLPKEAEESEKSKKPQVSNDEIPENNFSYEKEQAKSGRVFAEIMREAEEREKRRESGEK